MVGNEDLREAAKNDDMRVAKRCLKKPLFGKPKADVNSAGADGRTALAIAAHNGYTDFAGYLIEHGADTEKKSRVGQTPLHEAAWKGHTKTCAILLKMGANIDSVEKNRWTPMHMAAYNGQLKVVSLFLSSGADPMARNADNKTSIDLARDRGMPVTLAALQKAAEAAVPMDLGGGVDASAPVFDSASAEAPAEAPAAPPVGPRAAGLSGDWPWSTLRLAEACARSAANAALGGLQSVSAELSPPLVMSSFDSQRALWNHLDEELLDALEQIVEMCVAQLSAGSMSAPIGKVELFYSHDLAGALEQNILPALCASADVAASWRAPRAIYGAGDIRQMNGDGEETQLARIQLRERSGNALAALATAAPGAALISSVFRGVAVVPVVRGVSASDAASAAGLAICGDDVSGGALGTGSYFVTDAELASRRAGDGGALLVALAATANVFPAIERASEHAPNWTLREGGAVPGYDAHFALSREENGELLPVEVVDATGGEVGELVLFGSRGRVFPCALLHFDIKD